MSKGAPLFRKRPASGLKLTYMARTSLIDRNDADFAHAGSSRTDAINITHPNKVVATQHFFFPSFPT